MVALGTIVDVLDVHSVGKWTVQTIINHKSGEHTVNVISARNVILSIFTNTRSLVGQVPTLNRTFPTIVAGRANGKPPVS